LGSGTELAGQKRNSQVQSSLIHDLTNKFNKTFSRMEEKPNQTDGTEPKVHRKN